MNAVGEQSVGTIEPERVRLLADRLCWLKEGQDGLRRRHGLWNAFRQSRLTYTDEYDLEAGRLAPTLMKPLAIPVFEKKSVGWQQPTLF